MSNNNDNIEMIFERWKAALQGKPRSREFVAVNFDELFDELKNAGATLAEARAMTVRAAKAHQPSSKIQKLYWNRVRREPANVGVSESEWIAEWNNFIQDSATTSMFSFFTIPKEHEEVEQKLYNANKTSAKEYKLQREHADKFQPIDLNSLQATSSELLSEEELLELVRNHKDE